MPNSMLIGGMGGHGSGNTMLIGGLADEQSGNGGGASGGGGGGGASGGLLVTPSLLAQEYVVGDKVPVCASYIGNQAWTAESGTFTLYRYGNIVAGYDAIAVTLAPNTTGLEWTATVTLDLTFGAAHLVPAGIYEAFVEVTDSRGFVYYAQGTITVAPQPNQPDSVEYALGGGAG